MNEATQRQLGVPPSATRVRLHLEDAPDFPKVSDGPSPQQNTVEEVEALPEAERLAYLKGKLDGYREGREMKLLVEQQRSDLLHALEKVLVVETTPVAHEIARRAIDRVRSETDAALGRG